MNDFKVLFISLLLLVTTGCDQVKDLKGGADVKNATDVTLAQLKQATKDEPFFFCSGGDKNFNYFFVGKLPMQDKSDMKHFRMSSRVTLLPEIQRSIDDWNKRQVEPGTIGINVHFVDETIKRWHGSQDK